MARAAEHHNAASDDTQHIFVYGSLRESISHPMRNLLLHHGRFLDNGIFQGKLYDLGRYPGVIASNSKTDRVVGEVFKITRPRHVLELLDDYEGRRFKREKVTILLEHTEDAMTCWAYIYTRSVAGRIYIPSGDYVQYRKGSERGF